MHFSLSDAAKKAGISRSSIYRLIDEGKLSATTDHRGKKVVELTELLRVFGSIQDETGQNKSQEEKKNKSVNISGSISKTGQDTLVSAAQELERLRYQLQLKDMELKLKDKELELVQERLGDMKQAVEQVGQEKNKLLEILERQTLLLAAPKPQRSTSQPRSKAVKPAATQAKARPVKASTALKTASKPVQKKTVKTVAKPVPVKAKTATLTKKALPPKKALPLKTSKKPVSKQPTAKTAPKLIAKAKSTKPKKK